MFMVFLPVGGLYQKEEYIRYEKYITLRKIVRLTESADFLWLRRPDRVLYIVKGRASISSLTGNHPNKAQGNDDFRM